MLLALHADTVAELDPDDRSRLLALRQVRDAADGLDELPESDRDDRAVRNVVAGHLARRDVFDDGVARFLALWCNIGTARRDVEGDWQVAAGLASHEGLGTRGDTYESVRVAISRRSGRAHDAIGRLADVIVAAERQRGAYRTWLHGERVSEETARYGDPPAGDVFDDGAHRGGARLVVLTAHHGTGLRKAAAKYAARCPGAEVIDFDSEVVNAGAECLSEALRPPARLSRERQLAHIYGLNRRTVQYVCREAIERSWPRLLEGLRAGRTVVFAFPATVYHAESGAVSTVVNDAALVEALRDARREEPAVRRALQEAIVVTLIDDVFDCFVRLQQLGEPFDPTTAWELYPYRSAAMRTILEWRQREVMAAERTARLLGWRHVILPTKHPIDTLIRIIDGTPVVYLSHAVRHVRPRGTAHPGGDGSGPSTEHERTLALCRALSAEGIALIEPLTIDELRFFEQIDEVRRNVTITSTTELLPRWERPAELVARAGELLWAEVDAGQLELIEQPFPPRDDATDATDGDDRGDRGDRGGRGERGDRDEPSEPAELQPARIWTPETASTLLVLRSDLERQLRWRIRLLLNEAHGGLLLYRPYAPQTGRLRERLRREVEVWHQLAEHEAQPGVTARGPQRAGAGRPLVVHHPPADDEVRAVQHVAWCLARHMVDRVYVQADVAEVAIAIRSWVRAQLGRPTEPAVDVAAAVELLGIVGRLPGGGHHLGAPPVGGLSVPADVERQYEELADQLDAIVRGRRGETYEFGTLLFGDDAMWVASGTDDVGTESLARAMVAATRTAVHRGVTTTR